MEGLKKVDLGWKCIKEQFLKKAKETSIDNGEGISLFRFLKNKTNEGFNCEYFYIDKKTPLWSSIMERIPEKIVFLQKYKEEEMYVVCIIVPVDDGELISVKLFNFFNDGEVEY